MVLDYLLNQTTDLVDKNRERYINYNNFVRYSEEHSTVDERQSTVTDRVSRRISKYSNMGYIHRVIRNYNKIVDYEQNIKPMLKQDVLVINSPNQIEFIKKEFLTVVKYACLYDDKIYKQSNKYVVPKGVNPYLVKKLGVVLNQHNFEIVRGIA